MQDKTTEISFPVRHIVTPHIKNFRDTGGYVTKSGRITPWGRLFRCNGLFNACEEDWSVLRNLGIRSALDLRRTMESEDMPVHCPGDIEYMNIPMHRHNVDFYLSTYMGEGGTMGEAYCIIMKANPDAIAEELTYINEKLKTGNVVYFCHSGKDRTGMITALIQYILGVYSEDIISDYQISNTHLSIGEGEAGFEADAYDRSKHSVIDYSDPETMLAVLRMIEKDNYFDTLYENGLTRKVVEELREQLLVN